MIECLFFEIMRAHFVFSFTSSIFKTKFEIFNLIEIFATATVVRSHTSHFFPLKNVIAAQNSSQARWCCAVQPCDGCCSFVQHGCHRPATTGEGSASTPPNYNFTKFDTWLDVRVNYKYTKFNTWSDVCVCALTYCVAVGKG